MGGTRDLGRAGSAHDPGARIGLWPTLILAAALVVPYAVDQATNLEPYPAAILPGGATEVVTRDGVVTYTATALFGWNEEGDLVRIDADELLDPIWGHYLKEMARFGFGLTDLVDRVVHVRGTGATFSVRRHRPSADQRGELRTWFTGRLSELGLDDRRFVVRQLEIDADVDTGETIATRTRSETVVDL